MSLDPINEGDLVMVIKPKSCCGAGQIGFIFIAEDVRRGEGTCAHCGDKDNDWSAKVSGVDGWVQTYRLKRIPPQTELESVDQPEEVCV